jgi:hypothetical protein
MSDNDPVICKKTLALFFLAALWLGAADFWQKKKYTDWTPKEAQQMVKDSPWARPVSVRLDTGGRNTGSGGGRGGKGGGGGGRGGGGGGIMDASSGSASDPMRGGGGGGGGGMAGEGDPSIMAVVRWHSALPVKQAVARIRFGDEAATAPEAAKMLAREETSYVVGIANLPPMAMRAKPDQIKSTAFLKVKGKEPIAAADVRAERDQANRVNVYLVFPRTPIEVSDQEVEVTVKLATIEIHRKFKLKDMVFDGKLRL